MTPDEYAQFESAWKGFCEFYSVHEAFKYGIEKCWGPYFREERDIVFHLARFCLKRFGQGYVHLDSPISHYFFNNYAESDRTIFIDIDITDPEAFIRRGTMHGIFVEVKWFYKDISMMQSLFVTRRKKGVLKDLRKLSEQINNKRCRYGFLCIIDEEPQHSGIDNQKKLDWEREYSPVQVWLFQPTVARELYEKTSRRVRVLNGYPRVDLGIARVVEDLNRCGFKTTASCSVLPKDHPEGIFPFKEEPYGSAYVRVEGKCPDLIEIGEEAGWDWRLHGKAYADTRKRKPIDSTDFRGRCTVVHRFDFHVTKKLERVFDGTKSHCEKTKETLSSKEEALQSADLIDATSLYFESDNSEAIQERIKRLENVLQQRLL
ncbi:MAG: hypothetical protein ABSB28_12190 [Candidatus Bathyarchaeia archaeon]